MTRWLSRRALTPTEMSRLLQVGGALAVLASVAVAIPRWSAVDGAEAWVCLAFLITIFLAEFVRITLRGARDVSPLSSASALGFVLATGLPGGEHLRFGSAIAIVVVAVAMAAAVLVRRAMHRSIGLDETIIRFLTVAAVAVVYRSSVWPGELQLLRYAQLDSTPRWVVAVVMLSAAALGLTLQAFLSACTVVVREHGSLRRAVADEIEAGVALNAATASTGALMALAMPALGFVSLPLFVFPLALTFFAVRRQVEVQNVRRQTTAVLSELTDRAGLTSPGHANRVAALSVAMGRELGLPERMLNQLEYAALLHDIGQVSLRTPLPGGATTLAAPADQDRIAEAGAAIVEQTVGIDTLGVTMRTQAAGFRQVREHGVAIPIQSRIIKVANAYDDLLSAAVGARRLGASDAAMERIHLGLGYEYDPRVVDALSTVIARDGRNGARPTTVGQVSRPVGRPGSR